MTHPIELAYTIRIIPQDGNNPPGKLADAEIWWAHGPLADLKLVGFGIWERRGASGKNVTFPARQYQVNGERRSFALLRPIADTNASNNVRDLIIQAYEEYIELRDQAIARRDQEFHEASTPTPAAAANSTETKDEEIAPATPKAPTFDF